MRIHNLYKKLPEFAEKSLEKTRAVIRESIRFQDRMEQETAEFIDEAIERISNFSSIINGNFETHTFNPRMAPIPEENPLQGERP